MSMSMYGVCRYVCVCVYLMYVFVCVPYIPPSHVRIYPCVCALLGESDGGELLSEKAYKELQEKAKVAAKNRLFVTYHCLPLNQDCYTIGKSTSSTLNCASPFIRTIVLQSSTNVKPCLVAFSLSKIV